VEVVIIGDHVYKISSLRFPVTNTSVFAVAVSAFTSFHEIASMASFFSFEVNNGGVYNYLFASSIACTYVWPTFNPY
jgi:hypothetical protein